MSESIISLWGGPTGERNPSPALIEVLEKWLEKAKSGEVIGAAIIGVYQDNLSGYHLAGKVGGYCMLGALEMVKAEIVDINRS